MGDKVVVLLLDGPFELPQAGWTAVLVWPQPHALSPNVARGLQLAELRLDESFKVIQPRFQPARGLALSKLRASRHVFFSGRAVPLWRGLKPRAEVARHGGGCERGLLSYSQFCGPQSGTV